MRQAFILTLYIFSCCQKATAQVYNTGTFWYDTDGKHINAHGGGILYQNGIYYWYGEYKGRGELGNVAMDGVSCYSSKDLKNWKAEGLVLKVINDTASALQPGCLIERPKVIYNPRTKKYVMWFHHELKGKGYTAAMAGLAIADKPTGPFKYVRSIRPNKATWPVNFPDSMKKALPPGKQITRQDNDFNLKKEMGYLVRRDFETGQMSRDMTLFIDDDGTAYQITSSEDNGTLHVNKLTADYLGFTGEYYRVLPGGSNEAPALIKHEGRYYLITSGTTGWAPNPARSFVADKITGPYESLGNPVVGSDADKATTFRSQGTYILPVAGKKGVYIFIADRWVPENHIDGTYVWLPLTIDNGRPFIRMVVP